MPSPPSARHAGFSLGAGYDVEREIVRLREQAGHTVRGLKVGFANKALWRALKLETVAWARMYSDTVRFAAGNRAELVLDAMEMAIGQRRPGDVIHHSDQGSQYRSLAFGKRCREAGVRPSMGSVGDAYDNAMCESFFATLECELLDRRRFTSQAEAKMACFSFIEGWYNPVRLHSSLGYRSPMAYEEAMQAAVAEP